MRDWIGGSSAPVDYLTTMAVNTVGAQTLNITSLLNPSYTALLFVWHPTGAAGGDSALVSVSSTPAGPLFAPESNVFPDTQLFVPFDSQYYLNNPTISATVTVLPAAGSVTPMTGSLDIFGVMGTGLVIPVIRQQFIGTGKETGSVNVATTTTGAILSPPQFGFYYRLKMLSWWTTSAPAAAQRVSWINDTTGKILLGTAGGASAPQQSQVACDIYNDGGVDLLNNLSVTISAVVAYELWTI